MAGGTLTTINENNNSTSCQAVSGEDLALLTIQDSLSLTKTLNFREGRWLAQGHSHAGGQVVRPIPTQGPCSVQPQAGLCDLCNSHSCAHLTEMLQATPRGRPAWFSHQHITSTTGAINSTYHPPSGSRTGQTHGLAPIPGPITQYILKMTPPYFDESYFD